MVAGGVIFAILTDGFENASCTFTRKDVKDRIEHQSTKYSWEFRFLAANQDAITTGHDFGLAAESCATFDASEAGVARMCCEDSAFATGVRAMRLFSRARRATRKRK